MKKLMTVLFALTAFALVSGCGGSDSTPAAVNNNLSGVAATGAPIVGTVTVKDALGAEATIATGTNGSFTLSVAGMTPPYLLKVVPASGPTLYSYATQNGQTVNLTSTTNLALFLASGKADLAAIYAAWNGTAVTAAAIATAEGVVRANLVTQITAAGLDAASINLFTTPFVANGAGIDGVMDNLAITIGTGTYTFTTAAGGVLAFDEAAVPPAAGTPAASTSIMLKSASGVDVAADGTWSTCVPTNNTNQRQIVIFSGNSITMQSFNQTSGSGVTCTGGVEDTTLKVVATAGTVTTRVMTGWMNGMGVVVSAPANSAATGNLSATPTVTVIPVTGTYGGVAIPPGTELIHFVDNTSTPFTLYRSKDANHLVTVDAFLK